MDWVNENRVRINGSTNCHVYWLLDLKCVLLSLFCVSLHVAFIVIWNIVCVVGISSDVLRGRAAGWSTVMFSLDNTPMLNVWLLTTKRQITVSYSLISRLTDQQCWEITRLKVIDYNYWLLVSNCNLITVIRLQQGLSNRLLHRVSKKTVKIIFVRTLANFHRF